MAAALALGWAGGAPVAHAQAPGEYFNTYDPLSSHRAVLLFHAQGMTSTGWRIENTSDVDHFVIACSQELPDQPPRFLTNVGIKLDIYAGDLDIDAYTPGGGWYGYSHGITLTENIAIPGNLTSVVLKVFPYQEAIGSYSVYFECR